MKRTILAIFLISFAMGCEQKPATDATAEGAVAQKADETKPEETKKDEAAPTSAPTSQPDEHAKHEAKPAAALPDDLPAGQTQLYGSRFTIIEPALTLADALKKSEAHEGPYKVEATMEKVCAKKGCWFTLKGEGVESPVRVRMKDYGFFVPRNAATAKAVVEGTLKVRDMPKDEAQHYAEDEGKSKEEVAKIEGGKTYEFTATSVEVTMPKS